MERPVYALDGTTFSTLEGFYDAFERAVIPGTRWGRNLDALDDVLSGGFGTPDGGFVLTWRHAARSRARLGHEETVRQLAHRLQTCHPANREAVARDLEAARRSEGPTVFDWLVAIIRGHEEIDLRLQECARPSR